MPYSEFLRSCVMVARMPFTWNVLTWMSCLRMTGFAQGVWDEEITIAPATPM